MSFKEKLRRKMFPTKEEKMQDLREENEVLALKATNEKHKANIRKSKAKGKPKQAGGGMGSRKVPSFLEI